MVIKSKKGAEMAIGTIVVIILAILVLVFLVFGFSQGWGNLWDRVTNLGGGQVNVQTVVQTCQVACTTGDNYGYNTLKRNVVFEKGYSASLNCEDLEKDVIFSADKKSVGCVEDTETPAKECDRTFNKVITSPCTTLTN